MTIHVPIRKEFLKGYFDSYLVPLKPIAARFTISREDYFKILKEAEDNDIEIFQFEHGFHHDYGGGVLVCAARDGDNMICIGAFETEGDLKNANAELIRESLKRQLEGS